MKPQRLFLENFGPFAGKIEIDFTKLDDIFLITGKTGAGKTTIFDAVCFALYGAVPGGRNAHLARLKTDFGAAFNGAADDDTDTLFDVPESNTGACSVTLEFSVGERVFRAERSPKQEKPKKRGAGIMLAEEEAILYEWLNGVWEIASSRKVDADEKIKALIGLDAKEFFKIVLLPQGEFAEFLRQNTNERRTVLSKLFPIERAVRVKEAVAARARIANDALAAARLALEASEKRCAESNVDEIQETFSEKLNLIREKIEKLREEKERLAKKIDLTRRKDALLLRLDAIRADIDQNVSDAVAIREKKDALELSKKTHPLRGTLVLAEEAEKTLLRRQTEAVSAEESAAAASAVASAAETAALTLCDIEEKAKALRETRPALFEALDAEELLARKQREIADEEKFGREKGAQKLEQERRVTARDLEIQRLQTHAAQVQNLDSQHEKAKAVFESLVRLRKLLSDDIEPLEKEEIALSDEIHALETKVQDTVAHIPTLADEVRALRDEKKAHEQADAAAVLAGALKKGEPCPVCGSCDHPHPAAAVERAFGLDERIDALDKAQKAAERDTAAYRAELDEKKRTLEKMRRDLTLRRHDADEAARVAGIPQDSGFPLSAPDIAVRVEQQRAAFNALTAEWGDAKQAGSKLPALYKEKEADAARLAETEKFLAVSEEKRAALMAEKSALEEKRRRVLGRESGMDTLGDTGGIAVKRKLEETDAEIAQLETRVAALRSDKENADRVLAAALAAARSARTALEEAAVARTSAVSALSAALAESPFADISALNIAALSDETEYTFEREIRLWEDAQEKLLVQQAEAEHSLSSLRAELRAADGVAERGDEDEAAIIAKTERVGRELNEAEAERDSIRLDLASAERDSALLKEKRAEYATLLKKSEALSRLKDDLEGKNRNKWAFDSWLLGKYLAEVTVFATSRLERMSEGRYSLLLDAVGKKGRALSGLDLEVFDAHTGKTRPCATLSGGESFIASISLALGLADSIQERAGGIIKLDAVFIDEGFGSLDDATLDKALSILDELRSHRMVGLISHVGDLRTRIPSRIDVIKGSTGSKIRLSSS